MYPHMLQHRKVYRTCANSKATAPDPYCDLAANCLILLMTFTILLSGSLVGSPSVIVMTSTGFCIERLAIGPSTKGLRMRSCICVPSGVMPLN